MGVESGPTDLSSKAHSYTSGPESSPDSPSGAHSTPVTSTGWRDIFLWCSWVSSPSTSVRLNTPTKETEGPYPILRRAPFQGSKSGRPPVWNPSRYNTSQYGGGKDSG